MAFPEDDVSVVMVVISMNIKTVTSRVSEVSVGTFIVVESLSAVIVLILSHDNSSVVSQELTYLVRDGVVSSPHGSDGSSSSVRDEPLLGFPWFIISDSKSVLVSTNMLSNLERSVSCHS